MLYQQNFSQTLLKQKRSYKRHRSEENKRKNALPLLDRRKTLERVMKNLQLDLGSAPLFFPIYSNPDLNGWISSNPLLLQY